MSSQRPTYANLVFSMIEPFLTPIHKEGWVFILLFALVGTALSLVFHGTLWLWIGLTLCCVAFFRDPQRHTPEVSKCAIAPADGLVKAIEHAAPPTGPALPSGLDAEASSVARTWLKISIKVRWFDVHINRIPADGTIESQEHHPGRFAPWTQPHIHERQITHLRTSEGPMVIVQSAGAWVRRIVNDVDEGQQVLAGERLGIIRFGSQVDLYLPEPACPSVSVGQTVIGGESVIATMDGVHTSPARATVR